ncbi:hypothetical protein [Legionella oakridgensis]|uniref:Uncharacterized protein n=2 Tax=Legionella oakridgensis TaxID=29423 RepID=W0B7P1_9GAMM|nr:hypothetical protein [Legionella oakridgensis]AHE65865.1 hypothetical protein Loa_00276 [Legionella oakridgensis ATCC 33761 = DSM 21215]KTD39732.1 hypothetical protein Loak_0903 [Legionella oakridgensis]STY15799.1 Uncharacterised protein [Legionella longbeachae]
MKNYRHVAQGEFFVTTDPNTVLITIGMTECIAIAFIDRTNPSNRLLAHLDGQILSDFANAQENLLTLKKAFIDKTKATEFDVYLFGGQRKLRNYRILLPKMHEVQLPITYSLDINEFCQRYNASSRTKINPISACCTLICENTLKPLYTNYEANYFVPFMSESDLLEGNGLLERQERDEYKQFIQANEYILSKDPSAAQRLRTSADKDWIQEHSALTTKKFSI